MQQGVQGEVQEEQRSRGDRLRVALDATPLLGVRTGVGEFCVGALTALAKRDELSVSAFAVSWRRRDELAPMLPPGVHGAQRAMPARPLHMSWSRLPGPPVEWFIGPVDVVHGTNYVVPPTRHAARVVSVHDLTSLRYPQLCNPSTLAFPRLVRRAVAEGAFVHTPSRFVAAEVVEELGVDPARVHAVHLGIPLQADVARHVRTSELGHEDGERDDYGSGELGTQSGNASVGRMPADGTRYVLAVGTVEPRKDYPSLVRAFDALGPGLDDVALVIAGPDGWGAEALDRAVDSSARRNRISRLGYVSPVQLTRLLARASVVAYPSVYEGFGFVPLEAMRAGVPVVATAAGAIPEIVGDAAVLVAPGDVDAIAGALQTVLCDEAVRLSLVERGRSRAAAFSWDACAEGLSRLYAAAAR